MHESTKPPPLQVATRGYNIRQEQGRGHGPQAAMTAVIRPL